MSKITERNLVVGLDIGTSKISVAVGEITPDNQLSIVGVGNQPARGMDKGGVNDLNLVIQSIQRLQLTPFIPHKEAISGFVYDVDTGRLEKVSVAD